MTKGIRHFSKQDTQENMLIIISHWENENQNHNEIPLHTHYGGYNLKNQKISGNWQGCGETGTFVHC